MNTVIKNCLKVADQIVRDKIPLYRHQRQIENISLRLEEESVPKLECPNLQPKAVSSKDKCLAFLSLLEIAEKRAQIPPYLQKQKEWLLRWKLSGCPDPESWRDEAPPVEKIL